MRVCMYRSLSLSLSLSGVTVRSRPMKTPQATLPCKPIARTGWKLFTENPTSIDAILENSGQL